MQKYKQMLRLSFIFFSFSILAQKEGAIWYFGKNAGVDFSSGNPVALTNGALSTEEGCAVISSSNGSLAFYTDGISVWNKNHVIMKNGSDLKGNPSSTSSGVVIPKPNSPGLYYLFSVDDTGGPDGLTYSLIDLSKENGLGEVSDTLKNRSLATNVTEKLTAISHRNGKDCWVIAHAWKSDLFYAYLVTSKGVSANPVITKIGSVHDGSTLNTQGYMKASSDGTNIALALEESAVVELFDFDNSIGTLSNPIKVQMTNQTYPYGVEFSPDGSLLYVSAAGTGEVYQFNLYAGSDQAIQQSMLKVGQSPNKEWIGALQLAPDGKIYFPIYNTNFLGAVHRPSLLGKDCEYANNVVQLKDRFAQLGLPTFTQQFFTKEVNKAITYFDPTKVELNKALYLKNITFEFAKFSLKTSSYVELDKVVALLKANPSYTIKIVGHTDNIGNKSSNLTLSLNRAKAVKDYIVSKGIAENRVGYEGKGSVDPVAPNSTEKGRATNRRVEFVLLKK